MEIDITDFVTYGETWGFSGSVATHGANAAQSTWEAAKAEASRTPLLMAEEELQALRGHVQAMGFGEEVQGYDSHACNALFIQLISGDMRESGMDDCEIADFDWDAYYTRASEGQISGNIFKGDVVGNAGFGRIFYTLEG